MMFDDLGLDFAFEISFILLVLSAALSVLGYIPYIIDTLNRTTQPHRATWLIWSTLSTIALVSQVYEGATYSLWFVGAQVLGTITVFLLSIKLGAGEYLTRKNLIIFFFSLCGLVAWYLTDSAVYTLSLTIIISFLGGIITIQKAYLKPEGETLISWVFAVVAAFFAVISIDMNDLIVLAYPLYLLLLYAAIVIAMILGQRRTIRLRYKLIQSQKLWDEMFPALM